MSINLCTDGSFSVTINNKEIGYPKQEGGTPHKRYFYKGRWHSKTSKVNGKLCIFSKRENRHVPVKGLKIMKGGMPGESGPACVNVELPKDVLEKITTIAQNFVMSGQGGLKLEDLVALSIAITATTKEEEQTAKQAAKQAVMQQFLNNLPEGSVIVLDYWNTLSKQSRPQNVINNIEYLQDFDSVSVVWNSTRLDEPTEQLKHFATFLKREKLTKLACELRTKADQKKQLLRLAIKKVGNGTSGVFKVFKQIYKTIEDNRPLLTNNVLALDQKQINLQYIENDLGALHNIPDTLNQLLTKIKNEPDERYQFYYREELKGFIESPLEYIYNMMEPDM